MPERATVYGVWDKLVPGDPVGALVCAYPGTNTDPGGERLVGQRELPGEVAESMAGDLGYLPSGPGPGICSLVGGRQINYLVRFDYPGGERVWLTTAEEPNRCVSTSNGVFRTPSYIGSAMTATFRTGRWSRLENEDPCWKSAGRRGQERRMVPDRPIGVLVCGKDSKGGNVGRDHGPEVAASLAAELNSIVVHTRIGVSCQGPSTAHYNLQFRYEEGPGAGVTVLEGCDPSIHNGFLSGTGEFPRLKELAGG
ncbi:hypothetical protein HerbRD11066_58990 [Herbidospora sp. RD11066]